MEALLQLVERAKNDKSKILALKEMAVKCQDFEVAANFRDMEVRYFPETDEIKNEKKEAKEIQTAFSMVELKISEDICWLLLNVFKLHSIMGGDFSLNDAVKLMVKRKELYNVE
jgi:hypothetical protein